MTIWTPTIQKAAEPAYKALAQAIQQAIGRGELRPGERLPTHRELADRLGWNVSTVTRGYRAAENMGLVAGTVGRGTFVVSDALIASHTVCVGAPPINGLEMGLSWPLYHLEPDLSLAFRRLTERGRLESFLTYSDPRGHADHRRIGALWAARLGLNVSADDILIMAGAQHALTAIFTGLFKPGDRLAADGLTYPGMKTLAAMLGLRLVPIALDAHGMIPEELDAACRREAIKGLYLMPAVHNPTTITLGEDRREAIAELVRRHDLLLIEDDAYSLTSPSRLEPVTTRVPERGLFIAGLSKVLAAGLRVAFLTAPPALNKTLGQAVLNTIWMTPPLNVALIAGWIEDGTADRVLAAKRAEAGKRQRIAAELLAGLDVTTQESSYFLWLKLPPPWTGQAFELRARERGVKVFAAERFSIGYGPVPAAVRVSLTALADPADLRRGLELIKDIIQNEQAEQGPFL